MVMAAWSKPADLCAHRRERKPSREATFVKLLLDDPEPAIAALARALSLDPSNAHAHFLCGSLLREAEPRRALRHLSVALVLADPDEVAPTTDGCASVCVAGDVPL